MSTTTATASTTAASTTAAPPTTPGMTDVDGSAAVGGAACAGPATLTEAVSSSSPLVAVISVTPGGVPAGMVTSVVPVPSAPTDTLPSATSSGASASCQVAPSVLDVTVTGTGSPSLACRTPTCSAVSSVSRVERVGVITSPA